MSTLDELAGKVVAEVRVDATSAVVVLEGGVEVEFAVWVDWGRQDFGLAAWSSHPEDDES